MFYLCIFIDDVKQDNVLQWNSLFAVVYSCKLTDYSRNNFCSNSFAFIVSAYNWITFLCTHITQVCSVLIFDKLAQSLFPVHVKRYAMLKC